MHSSVTLNPSECLHYKSSYKRHAYLKATLPQDFSNMLVESDPYGALRTTAHTDALGLHLMILEGDIQQFEMWMVDYLW